VCKPLPDAAALLFRSERWFYSPWDKDWLKNNQIISQGEFQIFRSIPLGGYGKYNQEIIWLHIWWFLRASNVLDQNTGKMMAELEINKWRFSQSDQKFGYPHGGLQLGATRVFHPRRRTGSQAPSVFTALKNNDLVQLLSGWMQPEHNGQPRKRVPRTTRFLTNDELVLCALPSWRSSP